MHIPQCDCDTCLNRGGGQRAEALPVQTGLAPDDGVCQCMMCAKVRAGKMVRSHAPSYRGADV